jgi:hypothetical protein
MRAFTVIAESDLERVWRMTYEVYRGMGYCEPNDSGMLKHYPHLDGIPETQVFAIEDDDGNMQATNSATLDGVMGLHTDLAFPDETGGVRAYCAAHDLSLGDSWRIVTRPDNRNKMRTVLSIIDYTLAEMGRLLDVWLFTFNPAHARFYQRTLGLKVIAGPKDDATVCGASAVLMQGETMAMEWTWKKMRERL